MKNILNISMIIMLSLLTFSCFFDDDTKIAKSEISKIEIESEFDKLTFLAMETPNFGVKINQDGENKELSYQWSYGKKTPNENSYPIFGEEEIISNDSLLTYQFPYLGKYALKLIVDNGEDVKCTYFDLTISSGYDEGLAILTEDEAGKGNMAFLKTLSEYDISKGEEEKVIPAFYKDLEFNNPTSILSPYNKAIYITNKEGTIYVFDQQTMALDMISRPTELNDDFITSLSSYFYNSTGQRLGCYCFTKDKKVYRFNSSTGDLETLTTSDRYEQFRFEDIEAEKILKTNGSKQFYINHTKSTITGVYGNYGYYTDLSENYQLITVGYPYNQSSLYLYVVAIHKNDPSKYSVLKEKYLLTKIYDDRVYDLPSELTVNENTEFINSDEYDKYLYYTYKNKIYKWDFKYKAVPEVNDYLPFDIPDGEEIVKMCFNGDKDGTKLFVITYNESKSSELKGSIYVYDPDTMERLGTFENSLNKAIDAVYKKI